MTKRDEWAAAKAMYGMSAYYAHKAVCTVLGVDPNAGNADLAFQVAAARMADGRTDEELYGAMVGEFYSLTGMEPLQ